MRKYVRSHSGSLYFFTHVTHERAPFLTTPLARQALRNAFQKTRVAWPFDVVAIVLLPDHLHCIWQLPSRDADYSKRWHLIKARFSRAWLASGGEEGTRNKSRMLRHERGVWQRRYYEHTCRDLADLKRCVDYVHVNPLKHGLVKSVQDWPWSSFHRYVRLGEYSSDWGNADHWQRDEWSDVE
ncbi:transposase [Bremerella cremea]|uniref:Transposase n=1 Tax=Blastopirellula marina TaxID=124 RepID=A0A2S8FPX2_9BACT|nr:MULTISPECIES: transposase [Pirellulaceae]PQO34208.1 transposase [Blastopirellula marina]RCS46704.1 transposase [Bremerella cremea]